MTIFFMALIIIATAAAFLIMLLEKLGIRNAIIEFGPKLLSQLFSCDFCLSWWTCLIIASINTIVLHNWHYALLALLATPITRKLIV